MANTPLTIDLATVNWGSGGAYDVSYLPLDPQAEPSYCQIPPATPSDFSLPAPVFSTLDKTCKYEFPNIIPPPPVFIPEPFIPPLCERFNITGRFTVNGEDPETNNLMLTQDNCKPPPVLPFPPKTKDPFIFICCSQLSPWGCDQIESCSYAPDEGYENCDLYPIGFFVYLSGKTCDTAGRPLTPSECKTLTNNQQCLKEENLTYWEWKEVKQSHRCKFVKSNPLFVPNSIVMTSRNNCVDGGCGMDMAINLNIPPITAPSGGGGGGVACQWEWITIVKGGVLKEIQVCLKEEEAERPCCG